MESNGYEPRDRSLVGILATLTHGVLSRPDATDESVTAHTAPAHRSFLDRLDNWFADQELKSREAFLALPYFDHLHRFLIALMLREGYDVRYVEVGHRPRLHGRSKYGVWDRMVVGISDIFGVRWLQKRFRGAADSREI